MAVAPWNCRFPAACSDADHWLNNHPKSCIKIPVDGCKILKTSWQMTDTIIIPFPGQQLVLSIHSITSYFSRHDTKCIRANGTSALQYLDLPADLYNRYKLVWRCIEHFAWCPTKPPPPPLLHLPKTQLCVTDEGRDTRKSWAGFVEDPVQTAISWGLARVLSE